MKKKEGRYSKLLPKNQATAIFLKRDMRRNVVPKFVEICKGTPHAGAHPDGLQHGGRKLTETSVTEFCCKSVNLSLEELKNIKIILFLMYEQLR